MEIAMGLVGMSLTFLGIILAYIWRANGRYLRELQREIGLVAKELMDGQRRLMDGQEKIAKSVEEVAKITTEVLKEVRASR